jgi:adenosylcobinamide-phosphate synthase
MIILLFSMVNIWLALVALVTERLLGYPRALARLIGHPVVWVGSLLSWLENRFNNHTRAGGIIVLLIVIAVVAAVTLPITLTLRATPGGWLIEALFASTLLAQKELERHVSAVADGLVQSLEGGRDAVSKIVGRDPAQLNQSGVARGALESLAENTSDGITAPLLWLFVGGLPGIAIYKAVNTCDSMIGHKSERYLAFGWASARFDDLLNLVPARLTGLLFAIAAGHRTREAIAAMRRDARKHLSPNAGWPEAAMAGGLGIRLGGSRSYNGKLTELAWMGDGRAELDATDIQRGLRLYRRLLNILAGVCICAFALSFWV